MSDTYALHTENSSLSPLHQAALNYVRRGWHVLPLRPHRKEPLAGSNGHLGATTDDKTIHALWTSKPNNNIGIAPSENFLIVDVDPRNKGNESLAALEALLGGLPTTPTVQTPGGGTHRYFACGNGTYPFKKSLPKFPGIDFIYRNSYAVAPPSIHPNGGTYKWVAGRSPDEVELAMVPKGLVNLFDKPVSDAPKVKSSHTAAGSSKLPIVESILEGCSFMRHCKTDAATLSEPEWYAMLSITGQCADGTQHAHDISAEYPKYNYEETTQKLDHALKLPPRTCSDILNNLSYAGCTACPFRAAEMQSPIALGYQKEEVVRLQRNYVYDVQTSRYFPVAGKFLEPLHKQSFNDKFRHQRGLQIPLPDKAFLESKTAPKVEKVDYLAGVPELIHRSNEGPPVTCP